eukprot:2025064-Rhodomonas_salina.1
MAVPTCCTVSWLPRKSATATCRGHTLGQYHTHWVSTTHRHTVQLAPYYNTLQYSTVAAYARAVLHIGEQRQQHTLCQYRTSRTSRVGRYHYHTLCQYRTPHDCSSCAGTEA